MSLHPKRIFLDTTIYIIGVAFPQSPEARILTWAGFESADESEVVILVSDALFQQISRVGQRLHHKDWAGEIIGRIWREMTVDFVLLDEAQIRRLEAQKTIPREDITVYLTALNGKADCFVSANHELVRIMATESAVFECRTPADFVQTYLMKP